MNKIVVIIINGVPTSGKDTFVRFCQNIYYHTYGTYNVQNLSSVAFINQYMKVFGWDGSTKDDDYRDLVSHIKRYSISHGDMPTVNIMNKIIECKEEMREKETQDKNDKYIFVHIREISEIEKLVKALSGLSICGIYVRSLYIDSDVAYAVHKNNDKLNDSDQDAMSCLLYDYDYIVNNNKTLGERVLQEKAQKFMADIKEDINGNNIK